MSNKALQAVRGMNDLLPDAVVLWQRIEETARMVFSSYGYREIRFPLVEKTELYARAIGQVTDIVEKEMYTFADRNGESLTLRPEGTAGCVRAGIENGLFYNQVQRLWYAGPMFRHERPQKGRYRQFHQIGVETYGMEGPDIDAELILLTARLWRALKLDHLSLQINSLGTPECRTRYRQELVAYLESRRDALDEDSLRRLSTNPLRILDSKNPSMEAVISQAPRLLEYLDEASSAHFGQLQKYLDQAGLSYQVNPRLVRGLDYYTRTVFEWVSDKLGAQGTACAGGRYDGLVEQLGGKPTPAVGFALGLDRLVELVDQQALSPPATLHAYISVSGQGAEAQGLRLAESLRDVGLKAQLHCGGGSLKSQLKKADQSGAVYALLLDSAKSVIEIKPLRTQEPQQALPLDDVGHYLTARLLNI